MIGLIKKHLYMTRNHAIIFILCSLVYMLGYIFIKVVIFDSLIEDTEFSRFTLALMPLIIVMEFGNKALSFEQTGLKSEKYFNSLPVSRFNIIFSKYVGAIIFSLYGLIFSCICFTAFTYVDNVAITFTSYKYFIIAFFCYIIMLSLQLPILVNGGSEPLCFFISLIIIATPFAIIVAVNKLDVNDLIEKIPEFFNKHNISTNETLICSFILALIFVSISVIIATKAYKRREF